MEYAIWYETKDSENENVVKFGWLTSSFKVWTTSSEIAALKRVNALVKAFKGLRRYSTEYTVKEYTN